MPESYKARQGDCLSNIAAERGFYWETLWQHPDNAELKKQRGDPNILLPGDLVQVPDKQVRRESVAAEQRHRFRRRGVPASIRIVLQGKDGKPFGDMRYLLNIDGRNSEGKTGSDGVVELFVPANARAGTLRVPDLGLSMPLQLGGLDPITTIAGVQKRLTNLGYACGASGTLDEPTRGALQAFQTAQGLNATGEPDQSTQDKLKQVHGS
jgi:N-acetylmuramoyl-L-alanine amidase